MKTPKLIKVDVADPVALSRTGTDLDVLATALADARERIGSATRDREAAESSYREQILDASPDDLEKLQAAKARATVDLDRAEALVAALTKRIASVTDDRDRDARKAEHAEAVAKCDAIRARLPSEYRKHALALRTLLRDLAEAEVARRQAEPLVAEFGFIEPVEDSLRRLIRVPEEVIDVTEVILWTIEGRNQPVPADKQAAVRPHGQNGRGSLISVGTHQFDCVRQRYTRTRYRKEISAPFRDGSLLSTVNLPAFDAYGEPYVEADNFREAASALDHLARELVEPGEYDRPVLERLEMAGEPRPEEYVRQTQVLRSVA